MPLAKLEVPWHDKASDTNQVGCTQLARSNRDPQLISATPSPEEMPVGGIEDHDEVSRCAKCTDCQPPPIDFCSQVAWKWRTGASPPFARSR